MKYLFFGLLATCGACSLNDTDPRPPVAVAAPVVASVAQQPAEGPPERPNGSSIYYAYRVVHHANADSFAIKVNRLLDQG